MGDLIADKYVLRERLGAGGMGVVFVADQLALARTVAIKLVHAELAADTEATARFAREAHVASRLSHPNVAGVIDAGTTADGTPFLVMEHVRGETLTQRLSRGGALPLGSAVTIVTQVLSALGDAHAAGIVHADIKSDNVMLETLRDGTDWVKVIDFGLAHVADELDAARADGAVVVSGTPEYIAPEQVRGAPATAASDQYAVGVLLYQLVTGAPPFTGGTACEILLRHVNDVAVPMSLRRPDRAIPAALERAVARALDKDPDARHPSVSAFAAALAAAVRGEDGAPARAAIEELDPEVASIEATTQDLTVPVSPRTPSRRVLARGTEPPASIRAHRETTLRTALGDAIARGAFDEAARGYLELARWLVSARRSEDAVRELREGVLLLGIAGPASLWQILATLAALHDAAGDRTEAIRAAADAYRHAVARGSIVGRDRARALLERLSRTPRAR